MIYSSSQPPVIKANLGSNPWSTIDTVKPWIEYTLLDGTSLSLSSGGTELAADHELTQVASTPIWYHRLGDTAYVIPDVATTLVYYITAGATGAMIEEGTVDIADIGTVLTPGALTNADVRVPMSLESPGASSVIKLYPVYFTPKGNNDTIVSLDKVTVDIVHKSSSAVIHNDVSLVLTNGVYQFDWPVSYTTPEGLYLITLKAFKLPASSSNFIKYEYVAEVFRHKEYNPVRVKPGMLT